MPVRAAAPHPRSGWEPDGLDPARFIREVRHTPDAAPPSGVVDGLAALAGASFGGVVAQWVVTMPALSGGMPNVLLAGAQLAGLAGGYLALIGLLPAARVPVLDATIGLDRLINLHARLGRWTLLALVVHGVAVTFPYAALARIGPLAQFGTPVGRYPWVLPAAVGLVLVAGVGSWWRVRRRLR